MEVSFQRRRSPPTAYMNINIAAPLLKSPRSEVNLQDSLNLDNNDQIREEDQSSREVIASSHKSVTLCPSHLNKSNLVDKDSQIFEY